jgi:hypothetical protein
MQFSIGLLILIVCVVDRAAARGLHINVAQDIRLCRSTRKTCGLNYVKWS